MILLKILNQAPLVHFHLIWWNKLRKIVKHLSPFHFPSQIFSKQMESENLVGELGAMIKLLLCDLEVILKQPLAKQYKATYNRLFPRPRIGSFVYRAVLFKWKVKSCFSFFLQATICMQKMFPFHMIMLFLLFPTLHRRISRAINRHIYALNNMFVA